MGKPKAPKESEEAKAARLREQRIATAERTRASQQTATDLATDLHAIYGLRQISGFGKTAAK